MQPQDNEGVSGGDKLDQIRRVLRETQADSSLVPGATQTETYFDNSKCEQ